MSKKITKEQQAINMQKESIDTLNGHLRTIRKKAVSIREVGIAIDSLERNGVCPESLNPIREYQSMLAFDIHQTVNRALCDGE